MTTIQKTDFVSLEATKFARQYREGLKQLPPFQQLKFCLMKIEQNPQLMGTEGETAVFDTAIEFLEWVLK